MDTQEFQPIGNRKKLSFGQILTRIIVYCFIWLGWWCIAHHLLGSYGLYLDIFYTTFCSFNIVWLRDFNNWLFNTRHK